MRLFGPNPGQLVSLQEEIWGYRDTRGMAQRDSHVTSSNRTAIYKPKVRPPDKPALPTTRSQTPSSRTVHDKHVFHSGVRYERPSRLRQLPSLFLLSPACFLYSRPYLFPTACGSNSKPRPTARTPQGQRRSRQNPQDPTSGKHSTSSVF